MGHVTIVRTAAWKKHQALQAIRTELAVLANDLNYLCPRCHIPNWVRITRNDGMRCVYVTCPNCHLADNCGTVEIGTGWYHRRRTSVLKSKPCWPQHAPIIREIARLAKQVYRTCDHCQRLLYNGFIREVYGQKTRNNCCHCAGGSAAPPLGTPNPRESSDDDDEGDEDGYWWWDYTPERINDDIHEFQEMVLKRYK